MPVPNTFATATTSIPLSQLDANFATAITIGNTAVQLGNTITTINNTTLANTTISSGNATVTKITTPTVDAGSGTALSLQSNSTTGLYMDTSQNVGIGTTSPAAKFDLYNGGSQLKLGMTATGNGFAITNDPAYTLFQTANAVYMAFGTNGSERMRIDSSGNLLVGATSAVGNEKLHVEGSVANNLCRFINNNAAPYGPLIQYPAGVDPNGTSNEFIACNSNGNTQRFVVRSNGGIANYSANNVNLSDQRLKKDIQLAGSYLDKICAIPVKTFLYNDQTDNEPNLGVIAQDVEAVAPELVSNDGFGETPEDGVPYKTIYQTDLQYALMKAIQEQQALIQELSAEVTALKAKVGA